MPEKGVREMPIRNIKMWEPLTGDEHLLEIFRNNGVYVLMVDGAFYSDHESMEAAEEEMIDVVGWFGWSAMRPLWIA